VDMREPPADIARKGGIAYTLRPVEQEVIVIEDVQPLLGLHIGRKEVAQLGRLGGAPPGEKGPTLPGVGISF
jgi:hypothetical protein